MADVLIVVMLFWLIMELRELRKCLIVKAKEGHALLQFMKETLVDMPSNLWLRFKR